VGGGEEERKWSKNNGGKATEDEKTEGRERGGMGRVGDEEKGGMWER
jgi:hypothetical protein